MADSTPKVSVICTVKNGEATIGAVIESIIAQSFPSWEMIIVDDGSSDSTNAVVRRYCELDERIRLISTTGIGRGRALNLAVGEARGAYIANIDAELDPVWWTQETGIREMSIKEVQACRERIDHTHLSFVPRPFVSCVRAANP